MSHNQDPHESSAPEGPRSRSLSVFQIRDYRFVWGSTTLSNVCMNMDMVVLGLLVLYRTDSALWVALVGALRFTPWLVFGMFSGLIADRANRWRIMVLSRCGNVLVMSVGLALIATDWVQPWHTLLMALALGWVFVLDIPSRQSFIRDLVGSQNLVRAMSLDTITFTIGTILGPLLASLFIEITGFTGAYAFLLSLYALSLIGIIQVRSRIASPPAASQPIWQSLLRSVRYSLRNRTIRAVMAITLIMNFVAFSALQLFPVVARDHLHVGAGLTGVLISANGIGALIGAGVIVYLGTTRYHGRIFVIGSALQLTGLLLFALSPWYSLAFLMLLMVGLGTSGFTTMQSTIVIMSSTPERRGTALGVLGICFGIGPLGIVAMGALATLLNSPAAIAIAAGAGLLLMLPVMLLSPLMWRPTAVVATEAPLLQED